MEADASNLVHVCPELASTAAAGISHVAICCADIDKSCAFYRDILGFSEHCRLHYRTTGELMLVALKVSDDQWIELFDGRHVRNSSQVLYQVALKVPDAEAMRARCSQYALAVPEQVWQGQMMNLGFTTTDPNGITIEFVEGTKDSWMLRDQGLFLAEHRISCRISRVNIVSNASDDQNRLFFGRILGLTENIASHPAEAGDGLRFHDGPDEIAISSPYSAESRCSFTFAVPSVDRAVHLLKNAGYAGGFLAPGKAGQVAHACSLLDPDGMELVLREPGDG